MDDGSLRNHDGNFSWETGYFHVMHAFRNWRCLFQRAFFAAWASSARGLGPSAPQHLCR
jgi:hypothetical protein